MTLRPSKDDLRQAVKVALESMRAEVKRLAVDANLCDRVGLKESGTIRASKRRRRLLEAIATLSEMGRGAHGAQLARPELPEQARHDETMQR